MIISWIRSQRKRRRKARTASHSPAAEAEGPIARVKPAIHFQSAVLRPSIQNLSISMNRNSWVVLRGDDDFGIAVFCDLCFNFVQPEEGEVQSEFSSNDVSILGRSATTYGSTLWEHIICGATNVSKRDVLQFAPKVLRESAFKFGKTPNDLLQRLHQPINDFELSERGWLEISELNTLLQQRAAVVIDTESDFYRRAVIDGYTHSKLFLQREVLFLWIEGQQTVQAASKRPWQSKLASDKLLEINFTNESRPEYIN